MFWILGCKACGILVPQPGIRPTSFVLEGKVLTTGPPGKSLDIFKPICMILSEVCISYSILVLRKYPLNFLTNISLKLLKCYKYRYLIFNWFQARLNDFLKIWNHWTKERWYNLNHYTLCVNFGVNLHFLWKMFVLVHSNYFLFNKY